MAGKWFHLTEEGDRVEVDDKSTLEVVGFGQSSMSPDGTWAQVLLDDGQWYDHWTPAGAALPRAVEFLGFGPRSTPTLDIAALTEFINFGGHRARRTFYDQTGSGPDE